MGGEPSISIIIPSYERPEYALEAVQSVADQTMKPNEIILVNDGSTSDYQVVETKLANLDIATEYIKTENSGASAARNTGAKEATGEIYMFLDDDDRWCSNKIRNQIRIFAENPDVGLVYSAGKLITYNGDLIHHITTSEEGDLSREILLKNHIGSTSGVAVREAVFNEAGGFDPDLPGLQDYDLWIRICQITSVGADPEESVLWTRHSNPEEQMTGNPERYTKAVSKLLKKHENKYSVLPYLDRRRVIARQLAGIADRYSNMGSKKSYIYAIKSLLYYPTLRGFTELFPDKFVASLRRYTGR